MPFQHACEQREAALSDMDDTSLLSFGPAILTAFILRASNHL